MPTEPHSPARAPLLPRAVRRALDVMRADPGHEWNVRELARAASVSARTLQRQFRSFLGKTPHAALSDLRFETARRALLNSSPEAKVGNVALMSGIPHHGRFAVDYRRRYGETPSATLKRQSVLCGVLAGKPAFFAPGRDRPIVALDALEAEPVNAEAAREMAHALATALTRAGVSVSHQTGAARYLLSGGMRGIGRDARLSLRLIDLETGRHLWSHRADGVFAEGAAPEEHLAARIAAGMQPYLRSAEIDRARRKPEGELNPHDLALKAMPGVLALDADGNARALDLLTRATERDPEDALAIALAAWAHAQRIVYHFTSALQEERELGADLARKARSLPGDATALAVLGNAYSLLRDIEAAEAVVSKALATDGGSAWAWTRSGWIDVYKGELEPAIERFKIALDLAPDDPHAFNAMVGIGCAHFHAGNYLEAAGWQERALLEHPTAIWVNRTMAPAYLLGGDADNARRSASALMKQYPGLTIAEVRQGLPPLPQSYCDRIFDALEHLGVPAS